MENYDIETIWNAHSNSLRTELTLDYSELKNIKQTSTRLSLRRLLFRRLCESFIFFLLAIFLADFMQKNNESHYIISATVLVIFASLGMIASIWQIAMILKLDYAEPVTKFLSKLEKLKLLSLQTLRLLLLSIPFNLAYIIILAKAIIGYDIYVNANSAWLASQAIVSIMMVPAAIYIVYQLKNGPEKKWLRKLIADNGGKQIEDSIKFMNELKSYQKEEL